MNMLTRLSAASIFASLGALTAPLGFPIQRHQAPPKPRFGGVKRQKRAAVISIRKFDLDDNNFCDTHVL
ncbi:hypothetical protein EKK97_13810 [Billgrantia tianxiuensis]|uniref:Uncharacterized protein n=1 Tax=Billgrantia tianxiuensis TaxID=2497861 RepID=A0A6I6SMK5_9GAMM|nr:MULTISPECIES: hypothetical protein [Halomonas]MCE8034573.1 hypothetical protein [Halomonas sp. MCCC 1A11057]QHC50441.1 hypothetical protein EKK97_13810 [Halomonas tianxiuensis]